MSHSFKGITEDWHFLYLWFYGPPELEGKFSYQDPRIEQALMIGHDDVRMQFFYLLLAFYRQPSTREVDVEQRPELANKVDQISFSIEW